MGVGGDLKNLLGPEIWVKSWLPEAMKTIEYCIGFVWTRVKSWLMIYPSPTWFSVRGG